MLSALVIQTGSRLSLPDVRSRGELEVVRGRARAGGLVCPVCRQRLWLHAGVKRIAYFAHRQLNDCPQARVSEAVLTARSLLYQFFQERIASGKLMGAVELEPAAPPGFPFSPDLLLKREGHRPVAVVLLGAGLKPELRVALPDAVESAGMIFRPVFLVSRLKRVPGEPDLFVLDTTQREFRQDSPYGVIRDWQEAAQTLRFIDPVGAKWLSLRSLASVEPPQVFSALFQPSPLQELRWSQGYSDWVHPGEAEALQRRRQRKSAARMADVSPPPPPKVELQPVIIPEPPPILATPPPAETLPAWLKGGLLCVGCRVRTKDWQNADPANDACVCRACFKRGVRLGDQG